MHSLARRYIKTAILFLLLGLGLGLWMIVDRDLRLRELSSYLISAHTHSLLVGFVMMMILGVALWLFPRPDRADQQYRPLLAEGAYWLITLGTAGRTTGEIAESAAGDSVNRLLAVVIVVSAGLQSAGLGLFFYTMWTRIRPAGSRQREERGERF